MSLHALANDMASKGRHGDSMLVHMAPNEVAGLHALAQAHGENLTINPETGLPEAFRLDKLLPLFIGAGLTAASGGALTPLMAAGITGAGYTAATGSLEKGLMAGMGAYGGAGLAGGLSAAGTAAASTAAPVNPLAGMETAALENTAVAPAAQVQIGAPMVDSANLSQTGSNLFGSSTPSAYYGPSSGAEAMTVGNPPMPSTAPTPAPTPQSNFLSGMDAAALETKGVSGFNPANTDAYTNAKRGLSGLMDNPASREAFMSNVGGVGGLAKYAGAALLPAMQPDEQSPEKPAEGNVVDYSYDPISGKYRRLRSTPASQYQSTMSAKNGGITSLLSFASGGAAYSQADLDAIDAAVAAANDGTKTQAQREAARDELLSKYSAEALAAAPSLQSLGYTADQYSTAQTDLSDPTVAGPSGGPAFTPSGGRADSIRAGFIANRNNPQELMRLMTEFGVSVDELASVMGGDVKGYQNLFLQAGADPAFGGMNKYQAAPNDKAYIDYMLTQPNPYGQGTMADVYKAQGIDPYNDPRVISQARAENDRAVNRTKMYESAGLTAPKEQIAPWQNPNWKANQDAARQAEADRQQRLAEQDAKSGVTVGGGTTGGGIGGGSNLPVTNTVLPAFAGTNSPTGGISGLQVLTPQGVMGGSEKGGTVSNVSQIIPAYQQYWQNAPVGSTVDFAGGKLSRISGAQALFTAKNGSTYSMGPSSDLNIIAAQNPAIGETWRTEFGMVPQNYMQGESARAYEFLRGNEPYSVNQQVKGIARPYGEMAMGLPGATFGSNAVLNQREINEATAKQKADPKALGFLGVPAPVYGYGVTNPGTYNMETVFDPNTGRYVENNMYEKPADLLADANAVAATPSTTPSTPVNDGGMGGEKNGGLMHMAQGGLGALAGGGAAAQYDLGGYSDGGRLLRGPGDGVSDSIPATIGNKRPARLADGEFVVPARIVSELGNGSTEAGARKLYAMMDRVQKNRSRSVGKGKVAVNSNSSKFLPA